MIFEFGKIYKRKELHAQYGGSQQSGITPCARYPYIFIFTGKSGEHHGYVDGWNDENYFLYTGQGQEGDMVFLRGNKALRDHESDGKRVFLFESAGVGHCRFVDELRLVNYEYFDTHDRNGLMRRGIRFIFESAFGESTNANGKKRVSINYNKPSETERKGLVTSRVGQGWYRQRLIDRWEGKCAVTNCSITDILIASHIVPWKDATDEERLDPENGILLSPNLDALFDKHLISFDDSGQIIISSTLPASQYENLGISKELSLRMLTKQMKGYLSRHRQELK